MADAALANAAPASKGTPDTLSGDFECMQAYWNTVSTMLAGAKAMREAGATFLPRFENESDARYETRCKIARYTNVIADIFENLASKPFAEELKLDEKAAPSFVELAKNIDGRGASLHAFAADWFYHGVAYACDWILVDFPKSQAPKGRARSLAETTGLRPYWVRIPAHRMRAVRSAVVNGEEVIYHARFREDVIVTEGYDETLKKRVREYDRPVTYGPDGKPVAFGAPVWTLYEAQKDENDREKWVPIDTGTVSIGIIPMVPFMTGRRKGSSWEFTPALQGSVDLQIELFQLETGLKWTAMLTAYPMLAGNGVSPSIKAGKVEPVPVGPHSALYAPPTGDTGRFGEWKWIEPSGTSLTFMKDYVSDTKKELRELGRQPLTAESGNLTVVTTMFAAQKGNSACQAWALVLQAAIKRALQITGMWLKQEGEAPDVTVFTDFAIEMDDQGPTTLVAMRGKGDLTRETLWAEMRRRNILSADFDKDAETKNLDAEKKQNEADAQASFENQAKITAQYAVAKPAGPPKAA